jgi:hypothetical protein
MIDMVIAAFLMGVVVGGGVAIFACIGSIRIPSTRNNGRRS